MLRCFGGGSGGQLSKASKASSGAPRPTPRDSCESAVIEARISSERTITEQASLQTAVSAQVNEAPIIRAPSSDGPPSADAVAHPPPQHAPSPSNRLPKAASTDAGGTSEPQPPPAPASEPAPAAATPAAAAAPAVAAQVDCRQPPAAASTSEQPASPAPRSASPAVAAPAAPAAPAAVSATGAGTSAAPRGAAFEEAPLKQSSALSAAASSSQPAHHGLAASPLIKDMSPESVSTCNPVKIMEGVRLQPRELGRGSFGVVVLGSFHGQAVAVKVMLTSGLDRSALRELLLAPSLVHPCLVMVCLGSVARGWARRCGGQWNRVWGPARAQGTCYHSWETYTSRCAEVTHEFFDFLEGARNVSGITHDTSQPRTLLPAPFISGDGFGDPDHHMRGCGLDPMFLLHQILHDLRATTGQMLVLTVQEYCSKNTLLNAISKGVFREGERWDGRVALRALLRTASEVARGLWHLHDNGIVHGDIKPANILLASSGEDRRGFTAKLADFGLAHLLPTAANSISTEAFGSVAYMAPESFNGKVGRATDIYSFGVTLWQMLTGALPFRGMKPAQVVAGVQSGKLQLVWPDVPPMARRLVAVGRRCVAHKPGDRPSAGQLLEELTTTERDLRSLAPGAPPQQRSFPPSTDQSGSSRCSSSASTAAAAAAVSYAVVPQQVAWQQLQAGVGDAPHPPYQPVAGSEPRLPMAVPLSQHTPAGRAAVYAGPRYT